MRNGNRLKEGLKRIEVSLRPLIKWMLVALRALDADTEETIGKCHCFLLWQAQIAARPEMWHILTLGEVRRVVLSKVRAHFLNKFLIRLVRAGTTGPHDDALYNLIVGAIFRNTLVYPIVPITTRIKLSCVIINPQLRWAVPLEIIYLCSPPSCIGRPA